MWCYERSVNFKNWFDVRGNIQRGKYQTSSQKLKQGVPYEEAKRNREKKLSHISASVEYAKRIKEKPDSVFVDGNRNNIGNSAATLK